MGPLLLLLTLVVMMVGSGQGQLQQPVDVIVQNLAETVDSLQAKVQALENRLNSGNTGGQTQERVAFLAQYSNDHATGVASGPYVFDNVVMNVGNNYDPSTGIFTAPVSGIYLLGAQLFTDGGRKEHPFVDIKINGNTATRLAFEEASGQEDSDSTMITWHLQASDQVWIASEEGEEYHYWGMYHTFFTGTLIAAMPTPSGDTSPTDFP